eukprot:scaffold22505_cov22-Attheya_sp.AAC.1
MKDRILHVTNPHYRFSAAHKFLECLGSFQFLVVVPYQSHQYDPSDIIWLVSRKLSDGNVERGKELQQESVAACHLSTLCFTECDHKSRTFFF